MAREYKDSGIEWIGRIPKDWKTERIKSLFSERNERDCQGKTLLSVSQYYGIRPKSETDLANSHIAESYDDYKEVHKGDFVMNIMLAWNGSYAVSDYDGIVSPAYCVFKFRKDYCKKYFHYLLRTDGYPAAFKTMSRGVIDSRLRLYPEQFYTFPVVIPPLAEQQRIASYLDKKCAEIDSLVELQEQMIAQLTDYKQSVITEAVTKGLNPEAELVSSGIDWIGDYPKHWEIIKIGFIFDNLDYLREPISAELRERNNPQYDYYGASGVIDKIDHYNVDDKVLLIGEDGANLVMRNLPLIYKAEGKFWVNNHAHILKPKKDDYDYLAHALEAANYRNYITGSAQPKLSQENLQAVKLPIPPLAEQQAIASYLDTKCHEIDSLISLKRQKIEMLKDYKKSIIFEAVTGKTDLESLALIGRNHWH